MPAFNSGNYCSGGSTSGSTALVSVFFCESGVSVYVLESVRANSWMNSTKSRWMRCHRG